MTKLWRAGSQQILDFVEVCHILAGAGQSACGERTSTLSYVGFPAWLLPGVSNFCSSRATCAPQRFIPGELRWHSSCCGLLRTFPEVGFFVCAQKFLCIPQPDLPSPVLTGTAHSCECTGCWEISRGREFATSFSLQMCCSPKMSLEPLQAWNSELFDRLKLILFSVKAAMKLNFSAEGAERLPQPGWIIRTSKT